MYTYIHVSIHVDYTYVYTIYMIICVCEVQEQSIGKIPTKEHKSPRPRIVGLGGADQTGQNAQGTSYHLG